jgi:hypothetical protein
MLMIIQGCMFWCLYKKKIQLPTIVGRSIVIATDLNVDDNEGDQDNGFDILEYLCIRQLQ